MSQTWALETLIIIHIHIHIHIRIRIHIHIHIHINPKQDTCVQDGTSMMFPTSFPPKLSRKIPRPAAGPANFQVLSRELPSFNVGASCAEGASGVPQAEICALLGISRNFRPFFLISIYGLRWVKVSKWLRFISFISKPYWNML